MSDAKYFSGNTTNATTDGVNYYLTRIPCTPNVSRLAHLVCFCCFVLFVCYCCFVFFVCYCCFVCFCFVLFVCCCVSFCVVYLLFCVVFIVLCCLFLLFCVCCYCFVLFVCCCCFVLFVCVVLCLCFCFLFGVLCCLFVSWTKEKHNLLHICNILLFTTCHKILIFEVEMLNYLKRPAKSNLIQN